MNYTEWNHVTVKEARMIIKQRADWVNVKTPFGYMRVTKKEFEETLKDLDQDAIVEIRKAAKFSTWFVTNK